MGGGVDGKKWYSCIPTANDLALGLTNGDVITDYDKFNAICLVGMKCSVLFLGETKVKDITSVISVQNQSGKDDGYNGGRFT